MEAQIERLRDRLGLTYVVFAGDRGMLTSAQIERLKAVGGIGWVSCLRAPAIRALVTAGDLQLSLFDERDLVEITSSDFPGERLVVRRNPALAHKRARKREALLGATEAALGTVAGIVGRGRLKTKEHAHRTPDGLPVGSFRTLLAELATLTRNRVVPPGADERAAFEVVSEPTPLQARALELIGVSPGSM